MKLPDLNLGKEWALLELLTLGLTSPQEREMFTQLLSEKNLNWKLLLTQAERHKMLNYLAFEVTENYPDFLPQVVKQYLDDLLFLNRHKLKIYRREAAKIVTALQQEKVRFVGTKGIVLESTIYHGNGSRTLSDIDFMIAPEDRDVVSKILPDLGYEMGSFNTKTGKIIPHSRETLIGYKLNPDHLPSRVKLTGDVIIPCVELDIANSLTWTLSPFQVPIKAALAEVIYQDIPGINAVQLPCFSPSFQFVFTVLHLFKEAWIVGLTLEIKDKDVSLSKFADVVRLWQLHQDVLKSEEFKQMLQEFGIIDPVLWVLEHLDRTLNTDIVSNLNQTGKLREEWLFSASGAQGKKVQWKGTMRDRLYSFNRQQFF